jgi:hypothetical protein
MGFGMLLSYACIGKRRVRERHNAWWRSGSVRAAHRRMRTAKRRKQRHPGREDVVQAAAIATAEYRQAARDAQQQCWDTFCSKIESAGRVNWQQWHRSLGSESPALGSVRLNKDDPLPRTPQEAAQNLADYFRRVFTVAPTGPRARQKEVDEVNNFKQWPLNSTNVHVFSVEDMIAACKRIKATTAAGVDDIHPCFVKYGGRVMAESLTALLNMICKLGVFPSQWKCARGVALYKGKGDRSDPGNYRLLSITSIVARTLERVVKTRLWQRIGRHIASEQAGFRTQHSTTDNVFRTLRAIYAALDNKGTETLPCIFLDIAKAFDTVHHPSLLLKLHRLGVDDELWWFVRAFLSNRRCAIWGDGVTSAWFDVPCGVPQGSVLAPLLYAIFINDLVPWIKGQSNECECCLFADDVNIWPVAPFTDCDGGSVLERCMLRTTVWANTWRVCFNQKKCSLVVFGRGEKAGVVGKESGLSRLRLTGFYIERATSYNFLGVHLDEQLRWREQARAVLQRAQLAAYNITRLVRTLKQPSAAVIGRLCRAVLMPSMYYCLNMWRPSAADYKSMLSILCRPLRRVLSLPHYVSHVDVIAEFGFVPPAMERVKQLLDLRLRYRNLYDRDLGACADDGKQHGNNVGTGHGWMDG